jgi:hypothetical protein
MTIPPPPTLQEYMNAAIAVDKDNGRGVGPDLYPPASTGFTLVMDSTAINHSWLSDGMFAQAFMDSKGDIIVAFDSSIINPSDPNYNSPYGAASRSADLAIAGGSTPKAFLDADAFVKDLEHALGASYVASHPIYVEGHSLGGAEAEYVGAVDHLSGVTFGAPGTLTPRYGSLAPGQSFVNYVDYGDAVGNFGFHFGTVSEVGSPLHAAFAAVDPVDALKAYHVLSNYAADLHLSPTLPALPPR